MTHDKDKVDEIAKALGEGSKVDWQDRFRSVSSEDGPTCSAGKGRVLGRWRDRFPAQPTVTDLLSGKAAAPVGVERLLNAVQGSRAVS